MLAVDAPVGPEPRRDAAGHGLAAQLGRAVEEYVGRVIIGKADRTRLVTVALLADGHVLLDDVPGVAKTLMVRIISAAFGLAFSRIQCTPDLLPADVTGSLIFDQRHGEFEFRPGPLPPCMSWHAIPLTRSTARKRGASRRWRRPSSRESQGATTFWADERSGRITLSSSEGGSDAPPGARGSAAMVIGRDSC